MGFLSTTCAALALVSSVLAVPPTRVAPRQANPFQTTVVTDFAEPWSMAFLPDNRILVTEKRGQLRLVDPATKAKGTITGVPQVAYGGQGGFGDVAIHPRFAENGLVYISYAEAGTGGQSGAAVARARLVLNTSGGGALQNLEVIWRQNQKVGGNGHYGHRLLFERGSNNNSNNSTILWVSSGERQQFDPSQSMTSNLGKILRLNDDGSAADGNPFAAQGGVAAQVWALGIRNPLGIDLDDQGRLWEVEMGPMGGDEINLIERGANYGWPAVSNGNHYDGRQIPNHSTRPEFVAPKASWTPVISPAALIIYKGDLFPAWKGNAIIAGLGAQGLVRVEISGTTAREVQRIRIGKRTRCVRQSVDGALWVLEDGAGGRMLKLTPA
ncbi:putative sugar dehydrogenase [Podospora aff. communis PSN243]|uniref:Sugar dehydrogenase n=1 Tax=Podospora aff. communis PSN243 TaxID=3040156 RepID=A0AAV9G1C9_9PEZI|nr:putative sugar dehydrogenase [Podospora aff. communis PSN243]